MELTRPRLTRASADQMPLAAAPLAKVQVGYGRAQLDNLTGKFVAGDHGNGYGARGPVIPVPNMHIRAANSGLVDADQDILGPNLGHGRGDLPKPVARVRFLQGFHLVCHWITPRARPTLAKAASAWSRSSRERAALICVRMRA